jgi:hypothetical protein
MSGVNDREERAMAKRMKGMRSTHKSAEGEGRGKQFTSKRGKERSGKERKWAEGYRWCGSSPG